MWGRRPNNRCLIRLLLLVPLSTPLDSVCDERADLQERLEASLPQLTVTRMTRSSVPGVYAVDVRERGGTFYVTEDGVHLFAGDLYVLGKDGYVNSTEARRRLRRLELLAGVPSEDAIVFRPDGVTESALFVFTDTNCPHCRNFHGAVAELNRQGVEVRYLAYPMAGQGSPTYDDMVSVWCADDRRFAMTTAKNGGSITPFVCANPVVGQMALGDEIGVRGTPTFVTEQGELFQGYSNVRLVLAMLQRTAANERARIGPGVSPDGAHPVD